MDHTLEVEPKRAIPPKGEFTVVEHAIATPLKTAKAFGHRYPGDVAQSRQQSDRIEMLLAAVHKSLVGPSRHFAAQRYLVGIGA
ncbi:MULTISPECIES: hypothetical protein [Bradyrhizobium]|uniref:hypothetical protein n=1 Tax=Bradyrhizobium elkanii TaxID=29448 RepID=UPI0012BC3608|nr:hypothetical protein [Bradyrhizobium elkanii]